MALRAAEIHIARMLTVADAGDRSRGRDEGVFMANLDRFTLRANKGQYVEVDTGIFGRRDLRATAGSSKGPWQTFKFIDLGGHKVALQAWDGKYVCAENGGGGEVNASRTAIGPWETFGLVDLGGGQVALQAHNGKYVCAENGGGRELVANRTAIGPWESFSRGHVFPYWTFMDVAIGSAVSGGVTVRFDFGTGDRYTFNGTVLGAGVAIVAGPAEFFVAPEDLPGLGTVNCEFFGGIAGLQIGWQRLNHAPIGGGVCGGFVPLAGGAGQGSFTRI